MFSWPAYRNPAELAWLQEHQLLARHVCGLSALLFAVYGVVDAVLDPAALRYTWYWRALGAALCAFALVPLRGARVRPWAVAYIAWAAALVISLVNLIFLGILRMPDIGLAAQMQCLMMLGIIGNLRSVLHTAFVFMLLGFNLGLWYCAVAWNIYVLDNAFLCFGMVVLLLLSSAQQRQHAQLRQAREQLQAKDAQFHTAIESSPEGFCIIDGQGVVRDVNQAYCELCGHRRETLLGMNASHLEAPSSDGKTLHERLQNVRTSGSTTCELWHRRADGSAWPAEVIITYAEIEGGLFFIFVRDLTERKRTEDLIRHQAHFDALTDLPNRTLLFDRLEQECLLAQRTGTLVALLFADLDGFKPVNDQHGHAAGDWVLQEVARRWKHCVRACDTVARLGGDEFAVVLGGIQDPAVAELTAHKLLATLGAPMRLPGGAVVDCLGASIGIALFPTHAQDTDALISCADSAMYECKRQGKNRSTRFPPGV
ncbi:MAG: diguanylate cyclase domain-containing protein [Rhodoferax sp.]